MHAQGHPRHRSLFRHRPRHRAAPGHGRLPRLRRDPQPSGRRTVGPLRCRRRLTPLILDVTDAGHIATAADEINGHTPTAGLDGLVNNAGFGLACPTELLPLDTFRRQLEVNLIGQLAVTQALLPSLRRAQGRIVMVSTIGVRFTPPFAGSLDATKAALTALADTLRQELAPWRVRVVIVEPASINSGAAHKVTRDAAAAMAVATPEGRALY